MRPSKTYIDEEFIKLNSESIIFYSDIKDVTDLI